jgi:predicted ArsR family transcriptional regulator
LGHPCPVAHALQAPASTAELARRLDLSASAISQHLQALHGAGPVARSRHGRHVLYYYATEVGAALRDAPRAIFPGAVACSWFSTAAPATSLISQVRRIRGVLRSRLSIRMSARRCGEQALK